MPGCLYRLTFPSGKSYIGISRHSVDWRWKRHLVWVRLGSRTQVAMAIRKYGPETVTRETLVVADDIAYLRALEVAAIKAFNTLAPHGYNLVGGGEGTAEDLRELRRAVWRDPEYRANQSKKQRAAWDNAERKAEQARRTKALWEGEYGERMRAKHAARPKPTPRSKLSREEAAARRLAGWTPEKRAAHAERIRAVAASRRDELSAQAKAVMADPEARLRLARANTPLADKTFIKARKPVRGAFLRNVWDQIPEVSTFDDLFRIGFRGRVLANAVANGNLRILDAHHDQPGDARPSPAAPAEPCLQP